MYIYIYGLLTLALKVINEEPLLCMYLRPCGIALSRRQTIETHWPLFRESPTKTSRLFLNLSNKVVALNLYYNIQNTHISTLAQIPFTTIIIVKYLLHFSM